MQKTVESLPDFEKFQVQFTKHLRDPQKNPRPVGTPANRMKVYQELVFNGFEEVLSGCFPILKKILKKRKWNQLVRDFMIEHSCQKPFYRQIPDEFVEYLQNERKPNSEDLPFLTSLAHYEWMELVLFLSPNEIDQIKINSKGDLLENRPAFVPTSTLLNYPYPVHQIGPNFQPKKPSNELFYYLLFRNLEDEVRFVVLNPVSAKLVDLLMNKTPPLKKGDPGGFIMNELTGKEALQQIAEELHHPNPEIVFEGGLKTLNELKKEGAILGILKK